jgi:copper chaperone
MLFKVPDMTCQHCEKTIIAAVQAVDASAQVKCDVSTHEVAVVATSAQAVIKQAIIDAGYNVT